MNAPECGCERPRVFYPDENCHRCGRFAPPHKISANTWRLAIAIAEFFLRNGQGQRSKNSDPFV